jgi:murein DD-endopeptidase MepM/ murein hydrolase activator NlpD
MSRFFSLALVLLAAGAIAPVSPWPVPTRAAACGVPPMPVGPEVSIDGAPRFMWPLRGTLVYAPCSNGSERRFNGIDIAAPEGTPVKAAADGIVLYAGDELKGFGNVVLIRHDGDWVTAYAYARSLLVGRGNVVRQGRPVALSGRSVALGTPLLHFEIRKQSSPVDPLRLLPQRGDG